MKEEEEEEEEEERIEERENSYEKNKSDEWLKIYRNFPSIYKLLEHSKSIRSLLPLDYQCC